MPKLFDENRLASCDLKKLRASNLSDRTILANELHTARNALVFRYADFATGEFNGFARTRPHKPRIVDGSPVKYEQPAKTPLRAYFPIATLAKVREGNEPIFITEGEIKSLALSQDGFAAIGLGGVWGWKIKGTDKLLSDLAQVPWTGRDVFIVFDYDPKKATRRQVDGAAKRLKKALLNAGARAVSIVSLPPGADGGKQGVDDYLVANGPDQFRELIAGPLDAGDDMAVATMADAEKLVSSIEFLVDGVPYGMLTGVIAPPGTGKSAFVLGGLVQPVILGSKFFDGSQLPKPGYVLWCGTENDTAITIDRMRRWNIPRDRVLLPFAEDPLMAVSLTCDEHIARIEAIISKRQIRLVVIDSLRGSHTEDENNSRISGPLQSLAAIAERTGAAVVVIHHAKKLALDEELSANSSRGSNAIIGTFRSFIGISRPDPNSKWCRVSVLKENLGKAPEPFGFIVTDDGVEFGSAPMKPHRQTKRDLAEHFLKQVMQPGKWYAAKDLISDADDQQGIEKTALHRAKDLLKIATEKRKTGWFWKRP
jgi:hypothetical protein